MSKRYSATAWRDVPTSAPSRERIQRSAKLNRTGPGVDSSAWESTNLAAFHSLLQKLR